VDDFLQMGRELYGEKTPRATAPGTAVMLNEEPPSGQQGPYVYDTGKIFVDNPQYLILNIKCVRAIADVLGEATAETMVEACSSERAGLHARHHHILMTEEEGR
jgi:hypothetical protein